MAHPSETNSSSQPLKQGNNQLTTALIVIIVVLLFVMLMLSMNGQLFQSNGTPSSDTATERAHNARLRADLNAERLRRGLPPLPEDASSARTMSNRIQRDALALAALVGQWQTELQTKDKALSDLQSQLNAQNENAKRLYSQIAELQHNLDKAASANSQLASLSQQLKMANQQLENYRKQLAELQGRPSQAQLTALNKRLNDNLAIRNKLENELDALLAKTKNTVDRKLYDDLKEELAQLKPKVNAQHYEIQRLRALLNRTRLFIESEKDLPAAALQLFNELRTLEDATPQELEAAYRKIGATLGARIIHRQTFLKGSSRITFDREKIIQATLDKKTDNNSFFLVVGYASKSGDSKSNRKLSADRATTVASIIDTLKAEGQQVKAVYLGETNRFSKVSEIENQICEVWQIKR